MSKVYIVIGVSGEYEDYRERIVRVYENEGDAKVFVSLCEKEHLKQMERGWKFMDVDGIDDDIELWGKQHDKWAKCRNKFDPDWDPVDHGVDYSVTSERLWGAPYE